MVKHGNRKYLCTFVNMKTFVIAGCGRLAGIVSEAVVKGLLPEYELVGVYSRTAAKATYCRPDGKDRKKLYSMYYGR